MIACMQEKLSFVLAKFQSTLNHALLNWYGRPAGSARYNSMAFVHDLQTKWMGDIVRGKKHFSFSDYRVHATPDSFRDASVTYITLLRSHLLVIANLCLIFLSFGISVSFLGPSLLELSCILGVQLHTMSWVFFTQVFKAKGIYEKGTISRYSFYKMKRMTGWEPLAWNSHWCSIRIHHNHP